MHSNLWTTYSKTKTTFKLWSPKANLVQLHLYKKGDGDNRLKTEPLTLESDGIWELTLKGDYYGIYYTYQVQFNNIWLPETPGIYAQAVGVNGQRAMVLDFSTTNPKDWHLDKNPVLKQPNNAILYEMHIRDMTIHTNAGCSKPGTYLGLTEPNTHGPNGVKTGISHLLELGITHVHLLPTFDHFGIDETNLQTPQYNWGYNPNNYNVPEGSFSSNPFDAEARIKEFKQMVQAFHLNGIGVVMDIVYNHTGKTKTSNFNCEYPDYYYRKWKNGKYANGSDCGNETASEKPMMRKFMLESITHWIKEYHIDGFRFDLMGLHDIETVNMVAAHAKKLNPNILIYGEGWTASNTPLPYKQRALKEFAYKMPQISVFNDDLRDAIKGGVFKPKSKGFISGAKNKEESIKFGIVGGINHPQINYNAVNYSNAPWSQAPWQAINYVSCHDNHTLFDKLSLSTPKANLETKLKMHKLAAAIVLTSQGTPFLHAGCELLRTKNGLDNTYNLPDNINQINWNWKNDNSETFTYVKNLIALRKSQTAFRMGTTEEVQKHLKFTMVKNGLVCFEINNYGNDSWRDIMVCYNASTKHKNLKLKTNWKIGVLGDVFNLNNGIQVTNSIAIPAISMVVLYRN